MGISVKMVIAMMDNAGLDEDSIIRAFSIIKPIARYEGAPYYCPTKVSRYIKKQGH